MTANEIIQECYKGMCTIASNHVEGMAREVLRKRPDLHEFVSSNSNAYFLTKEGHHESIFHVEEAEELENFICEWEFKLNVTEGPMRFTADGPKITEW